MVFADKANGSCRQFPEYSQMVVSLVPNGNDSYRKVASIFRTTDARKWVPCGVRLYPPGRAKAVVALPAVCYIREPI